MPVLLATLLSVSALSGRPSNPPLNLSVKDADVRSVLAFIADSANMNLVMTDGVGGTVTVSLKKVRARAAFRAVLRAKGLEAEREGNVWVVMTAAEYAAWLERRRR